MTPIDPLYLIILLFTGAFTGLVSGLLGVGGGFIMSPVQFWVLQAAGLSPDLSLRIAFGTSLFVILPNAVSGVLKHQRKQAVLWKPAVLIGIFGSFASFGGAAVAAALPAAVLGRIFGATVILAALKTYMTPAVREEKDKNGTGILLYAAAGSLIGFFSGLVGIGGGVIGIPVMLLFLHFSMRESVGTSAAVMIFTSAGGALGYIVNGWGQPGLPPYSLGYINLLNWVLLAGPGILAARKGAQLAHMVNPEHLKCLFVILMLYIGLKMIGVF